MSKKDGLSFWQQVWVSAIGTAIGTGLLYFFGAFPYLIMAAKGYWHFFFTQAHIAGWLLTLMVLFSLSFFALAVYYLYKALLLPYVVYNVDTFYGIVWRWNYKNGKINGLVPFCPNCDTVLVAAYEHFAHRTSFVCETDNQTLRTEQGTF